MVNDSKIGMLWCQDAVVLVEWCVEQLSLPVSYSNMQFKDSLTIHHMTICDSSRGNSLSPNHCFES